MPSVSSPPRPLVHRRRQWVRVSVVLAHVILNGCRTDPVPSSRPDASLPVKPFPRYWLRDTPILDKPRGTKTHDIAGPVLVELLPDGRVRSPPGAKKAFEGYLPESLRHLPGEYGKGLLLYAQRAANLHIDRPSGPKAGVVYRGAFVTVAPSNDSQVLVGLPGFFRNKRPMVAFVDGSALGTASHELVLPKHAEKGKSYLGRPCTLWVGHSERPAEISTSSCIDLWVSFESRTASQRVGGVELRGVCSGLDDVDGPRPSRAFLSLDCPAHAVSWAGSELRLHGETSRAGTPAAVAAIPNGYQRVEPPDPDPLAEAIREGRSVWWLVEREISANRIDVTCEPWRFEPSDCSEPRILEGRLIAPKPWRGRKPHYPFAYYPSNAVEPARLHLDYLVQSPYGTLRKYDYKLLRAAGDVLDMMGRPIPPRIVAYDPGEPERWFLTGSACEAARTSAIAALTQDPAESTRLGFRCDIAYGS